MTSQRLLRTCIGPDERRKRTDSCTYLQICPLEPAVDVLLPGIGQVSPLTSGHGVRREAPRKSGKTQHFPIPRKCPDQHRPNPRTFSQVAHSRFIFVCAAGPLLNTHLRQDTSAQVRRYKVLACRHFAQVYGTQLRTSDKHLRHE